MPWTQDGGCEAGRKGAALVRAVRHLPRCFHGLAEGHYISQVQILWSGQRKVANLVDQLCSLVDISETPLIQGDAVGQLSQCSRRVRATFLLGGGLQHSRLLGVPIARSDPLTWYTQLERY